MYLNRVNVLQGTDSVHSFSNGNILPLVAAPFGMSSWCPQTKHDDTNWFFHPGDRRFFGLRLTHQPSPWIGDYGHFQLLPQTGTDSVDAYMRGTSFIPEQTTIMPHYFKVELLRYRTTMELTPTSRAASLRLTYKERNNARLLLAFFDSASSVEIDPVNRTISGFTSVNTGGVPHNFAHYFHIQFDCEFDVSRSGVYEKAENKSTKLSVRGKAAGAYVAFNLPQSSIVNAVIGTSFISLEQAKLNAQREIGAKNFAEVQEAVATLWEDKLSRIEVQGDDEEKLNTFYTCMYRSLLFPREMHEFDSDNKKVHYSPHNGELRSGPMYADVGFWDTYRTVWPLHQILFPSLAADILQGWVNVYKESGWMPKWVSPGERNVMPGTLIDMTIADALAKGIDNFDVETAKEGLINHAMKQAENPVHGRKGLDAYIKYGYLPHDQFSESVSNTLDYYYGDFCISTIASLLGDDENARLLHQRSQNYTKLFDASIGFMRGRNADGSWQTPFDPLDWGNPFCEGGAWQCSWAVQHDLLGLANAMGGKDKFVKKIDELMSSPAEFNVGSYDVEIHEMSEMAAAGLGQFAISNQPSFHIPYIYAALGYPSKTRKWVRHTLEHSFSAEPDGLPGDEDNGSTSSWYIFGALGLYPLTPGVPEYVLGSPLFDKALIKLEDGQTFTIEAGGQGASACQVDQIWLNKQIHQPLYLTHQQLMSGGTLLFETSEEAVDPEVSNELLPFSLSAHPERVSEKYAANIHKGQ